MSSAKNTAILIWGVIGNPLEKDIHPHKLPNPQTTNLLEPMGLSYIRHIYKLVDSPVSLSQ